jgi:hypothetical protein
LLLSPLLPSPWWQNLRPLLSLLWNSLLLLQSPHELLSPKLLNPQQHNMMMRHHQHQHRHQLHPQQVVNLV